MGSGTLHRVGVPVYPEAATPFEINPILAGAHNAIHGIEAIVRDDAVRNDEILSTSEYALRVYDAANWVARYHEGQGADNGTLSALRLLAGAARFGDVRQRIADGEGKLPREVYGPLVRYACTYNAHIRSFGYGVSAARLDHTVDAMSSIYEAVGGERSHRIFAKAVDGMWHQMLGKRVVEHAGPTREASLHEDLVEGYDVVLRVSKKEGVPIDITSCAAAVMKKCNLRRPATEAVRNGVLVVAVGVRRAEVGETFEIDESLAQKIYNKRMAGIIRRARQDPTIRRVAWRER